MRYLLINVDSRWNMAMRKMYNFYRQRGHEVVMQDLGLSAYPHKKEVTIDAAGFDIVFVSNIFDQNAYRVNVINCNYVRFGGIGSRNPKCQLPADIEMTKPYYAPNEKITYGFITRGCIRKCWFCKVPKYEGPLKVYNQVTDIVRGVPGELVKFLDNNILAYPNHMDVFNWLIERGTRCEFNQGLDFRLVNDENLAALTRLNYAGEYIFAFDDPKYQPLLDSKIKLIKKYIPKPWRVKFYIYYHPTMSLEQLFERVDWCRAHECLPYIMRDTACWSSGIKDFITDYAAYCNQPSFFKNVTFTEFLEKRHPNNKERRDHSAQLLKTKELKQCELTT
jgi:hypothetical protein